MVGDKALTNEELTKKVRSLETDLVSAIRTQNELAGRARELEDSFDKLVLQSIKRYTDAGGRLP